MKTIFTNGGAEQQCQGEEKVQAKMEYKHEFWD
jgi:hypothetical protein